MITPFAHGKWQKKLKWDGTGLAGTDILSGEIMKHHQLPKIVQSYFESLPRARMTWGRKTVHPEISLIEYKKFWKKTRGNSHVPFRF